MGTYLDQTELYLFNEGKNAYAYRALGCHRVIMEDGEPAYRFAVWAPNALSVSVVGTFNDWNINADVMRPCSTTGVWQAHVRDACEGDLYKFAIYTQNEELIFKADPFAFYSELRPDTASIIWNENTYTWHDGEYMAERPRRGAEAHTRPMSVYEVHLGSWRKGMDYETLADELADYVEEMGYTHVELMPLGEYPLDDSWGYQTTGYFSATSRYGDPNGLKLLIDSLHSRGIGVILDWVAAHFTKDDHGLRLFDGTALYEHADSRRSEQPQWGTLQFNYERSEVVSFLVSNAVFWLNEYHIDGLRADAVSCMLYLDFGKEGMGYLPNRYGGRENLGAIDFLKTLSTAVHREAPGALLIAEESTAFDGVTRSVSNGGLGFDFKWNMGWMNDVLSYMKQDSLYRKYSHDKLTFPMCYAFSEHFILPLSHDEVVHLKNSLIGRMKGNYDEMFMQLRELYMLQYAMPGKKLLFMGGEFGQFSEWNFKTSLDWMLLDYEHHAALREFVKALNAVYKHNAPLYRDDDSWAGFEWRRAEDALHSIIAFSRMDDDGNELLCVFNFTPVEHGAYPIRMPYNCRLKRVMSSIERKEPKVSVNKEDEDFVVRVELKGYEAAYYKVEKLNNKTIS